tara:strand:+ start:26817 stop:27128 length:312 start_codon:yes stop_codon:yes gene_type:complete
MENTFFKMIGQKSGNGKMIIVAVVDEDFMDCGEVPNIFEVQSFKQAPTIYSGTYPNIRINVGTLKDRTDLNGSGISGILTNEQWYCSTQEVKDEFGIGLPKNG